MIFAPAAIDTKGNVMGMRQWMNENSAVVTIVTAVVLIVAVVIVLTSISGGEEDDSAEPTRGKFFMDLTTNEPFVAPYDAVPPIDTPGGKKDQGVRAIYLTCGGCGDSYLGWLQRYTPKAKRLYLNIIEKNKTREIKLPVELAVRQGLPKGLEVRRPDGGKWVAESSARGQEITSSARNKCGQRAAQPCEPSD